MTRYKNASKSRKKLVRVRTQKRKRTRNTRKQIEGDSDKTLFIFYKFEENDKNKNWSYAKFPGKWRWIGSGATSSLKYPREEQFSGNSTHFDSMKVMLQQKMESLKKDNIIKHYKISEKYYL